MKTTDEVLQERGSVYGSFTQGSEIEAAMMNLICANYESQTGKPMSSINKVFFSKIIMKLSRLSVTPAHIDSWTDIAGYARLIEQHYEREKECQN
jgi:hypothetical protein